MGAGAGAGAGLSGMRIGWEGALTSGSDRRIGRVPIVAGSEGFARPAGIRPASVRTGTSGCGRYRSGITSGSRRPFGAVIVTSPACGSSARCDEGNTPIGVLSAVTGRRGKPWGKCDFGNTVVSPPGRGTTGNGNRPAFCENGATTMIGDPQAS